jgi:hypothetical protein
MREWKLTLDQNGPFVEPFSRKADTKLSPLWRLNPFTKREVISINGINQNVCPGDWDSIDNSSIILLVVRRNNLTLTVPLRETSSAFKLMAKPLSTLNFKYSLRMWSTIPMLSAISRRASLKLTSPMIRLWFNQQRFVWWVPFMNESLSTGLESTFLFDGTCTARHLKCTSHTESTSSSITYEWSNVNRKNYLTGFHRHTTMYELSRERLKKNLLIF